MSLYNQLKRQLRKELVGIDLVIVDRERDLEIMFSDTLNLETLKKVDRILKDNLQAVFFARGAKIVVRIEKEIDDLAEILAARKTARIEEQKTVIEAVEETELAKGVCDFCDGKGRIADLLPCYKCKETGIEIPEKSEKEDFWDWDEKVETYKNTKYYVAGIEIDLDTLI